MSEIKMETTTVDGLIFDLDGTIWDAAGTCAKAWNASLNQMGYKEQSVSDELIRSISGLKIDFVLKQCFSFLPEEKHPELLRFYKLNEAACMKKQGGRLFPQVRETLQQLQLRYPLFIVSNCLAGYIENFLSFTGLHGLFTDVECSGKTGLSKAENIRLIVQRNRLRSPLYIGDTHWDQEAATAAGVPFMFAAYGFGKVRTADWQLQSFAELPGLLSAFKTELQPKDQHD